MKRLLIAILLVSLPVTTILAQELEQLPVHEEEVEEISDFEYYTWEVVSSVLPLVVLFLVLFFIIRMATKRSQPYQQKLIEHTERLELKYDRIIELLEQFVNKRE